MNGFMLIRNIHVENANAINGQTWGFPAITHFLGYMHALERKQTESTGLKFTACAVICHQHQTHTIQPAPYAEHVFALTRNPLTKEAKSPPFVEEGRMNMTVSLLISIEDLDLPEDEVEASQLQLKRLASAQRLAGGTITSIGNVRLVSLAEGYEEQQRQTSIWLRSLLPGFALVARPELLAQQAELMQESNNPTFDAWLQNSCMHIDQHGERVNKDYSGWVVPIVTGYKAISPCYEPGKVSKSRDETSPVCFAEYAYTLGEWVSPHRINRFEKLFWRYASKENEGWYLCQNDYANNP